MSIYKTVLNTSASSKCQWSVRVVSGEFSSFSICFPAKTLCFPFRLVHRKKKLCLIAIKLIQHFLFASSLGKDKHGGIFNVFPPRKKRELFERKQIKRSTTTIWQVRKYANCKFIPPLYSSSFVITFFSDIFLALVSSLTAIWRECSFLWQKNIAKR